MSQTFASSVTFDIVDITRAQDKKQQFVRSQFPASASVKGAVSFGFRLTQDESDQIAKIVESAAKRIVLEELT